MGHRPLCRVHVRCPNDAVTVAQNAQRDVHVVDDVRRRRTVQRSADGEDRPVGAYHRAGIAFPLFDFLLQAPVQGTDSAGDAVGLGDVAQMAADAADGRVGEVAGEPVQRLHLKHHIGIGEHDDIGGGSGDQRVHADALAGAAPRLHHREPVGKRRQPLAGAVTVIVRAVDIGVDRQARRRLLKGDQIGDLLADHGLFAIGTEAQRQGGRQRRLIGPVGVGPAPTRRSGLSCQPQRHGIGGERMQRQQRGNRRGREQDDADHGRVPSRWRPWVKRVGKTAKARTRNTWKGSSKPLCGMKYVKNSIAPRTREWASRQTQIE